MPTLPEPAAADTRWFVHDRFGLFIHWGIYALPARHEWVKNRERITRRGLPAVLRPLRPRPLRPGAWAREADEAAGMKYFVVTTKHHDGFCLWDSALTDYKATNTPAGRDLLRPMVDAFRAEGLQSRLLPLADRLASSRVPRRRAPPAARRPGVPRRPSRTATSASTPSTCTARRASC